MELRKTIYVFVIFLKQEMMMQALSLMMPSLHKLFFTKFRRVIFSSTPVITICFEQLGGKSELNVTWCVIPRAVRCLFQFKKSVSCRYSPWCELEKCSFYSKVVQHEFSKSTFASMSSSKWISVNGILLKDKTTQFPLLLLGFRHKMGCFCLRFSNGICEVQVNAPCVMH